MIIDITISLLASAIEFYLACVLYRIFWAKKNCTRTYKGLVIVGYILFSILAALSPIPICATCCSVFSWFLIGLLYRISWVWRIACLLILATLLGIGEAVAASILAWITNYTVAEISRQKLFFLSGKVISKFIGLLLLKLLERLRKGKKLSDAKYSFMLSVSLLLASCLIVCTLAYFFQYSNDELALTLVILIYILLIFSAICSIDLLDRFYTLKLVQEKEKISKKSLQHEQRHYLAFLEQQNEIIQSLREAHDMKNKLVAVLGLLEDGQVNQAVTVIRKITKTSKELRLYATGNAALDAVIHSKLKDIRESHIRFSQTIVWPDICVVEEQDLAIIVGNIFDNAIHACQSVPKYERRFIHLVIKQKQDYLCFKMENSTASNHFSIQTTNDFNLLHGIGLNNVKMIADKYHGNVKVIKNGEASIFSITIILTNPA